MAISSSPIPTFTIDEINELTTSITSGTGTDTINWSNTADLSTTGTTTSVIGGSGSTYNPFNPGGGYTYTTNTTSPWISNGVTDNTMVVGRSGGIEIQGENADIKMNGKSMKAWMEKVEERLNILTPNPELEADWDDLRRLGNRYRALERKCREKAEMWAALKKVQPKRD